MGERSQRFAIIVEDGVATQVFVEAAENSKSQRGTCAWGAVG